MDLHRTGSCKPGIVLAAEFRLLDAECAKAIGAIRITFASDVGCLLPKDRQVVSVVGRKTSDHGYGDVSAFLGLFCLCLPNLAHKKMCSVHPAPEKC